MRVGFFHSVLRQDEKLLLEELRSRSVDVVQLDDRSYTFSLDTVEDLDVIFFRSVSHMRNAYAAAFFHMQGIRCVNPPAVYTICGDKLLTSLALHEHAIAQPRVHCAFSESASLSVLDNTGYPMVIKPVVGSWGRLLAKVNDRDAAEALLEHKFTLGGYQHGVVYMQDFVAKKGRDIRTFVVGDTCIAAIYRTSEHWITNTARGAVASNCPLTNDLIAISLAAARAVGGGLLAIDLFETDDGYIVNEVNSTMEFKNSIATTGVNIAKHVVDYVVGEANE